MNTKLKVNNSGNHYCGPMVLAAILGISTAEAAAEIRRIVGGYRIRGVYDSWIRRVLEAHGYRMTPYHTPTRTVKRKMFGREVERVEGVYTLASWMRSQRARAHMHDPFIVNVGHHYVLVRGRKFVDTHTNGEWVFLRSAPHRRKRVRSAYRITKNAVV